jgi:hypothetical protein
VNLPQLARIRWGVRAVLTLGVAASVVANVLHANDNPISQSIAAWPPLALLLTVELISRIPVHSRPLAAARVIATATIASIAAWVSYWHMAATASRYGETGAAPYLIPISVDGLIVVASICLVELAGRIRAAEESSRDARMAFEAARDAALAAAGPVDDEPVADPWQYATPIGPEPVKPDRVKARSLTAAERVTAAHEKLPAATHERIAKVAKVSVSTVKRHRPTGSPSEPAPAETRLNGHTPELTGVAL